MVYNVTVKYSNILRSVFFNQFFLFWAIIIKMTLPVMSLKKINFLK